MPGPLLTTKLYPPPIRRELVSRPRLLERLGAGSDRQLALVSAGAGFGKTTLVADWLSNAGCPATWLTLDQGDNDPVQFVTYLIAALQSVDAGLGQAALALLGTPQAPPIESLLTLLVNDMAITPRPPVIVLDDYDAIHNETIHKAIEFLIEHKPTQVQLILVTRHDPPLPLPRLRVRRQLIEIREQDLRFTAEEAGTFLRQALGLALDPGIIAILEAKTEGWIAGLQLAALSIQDRSADSVTTFVELFSGTHRHVIDYLAEEVLARQSGEIQGFLRQTSILDRLTAPLCDAVTGRSDGQAILRQLDESNLFLVALDDRRAWYRYHRLFADFLRTELDADAQASLHARASRWLVAHGFFREAVGHALSSGDLDHAADVIARASGEAFRSGAVATLQGWLHALPDTVVRSNSDLAIHQGFTLLFTGQKSQAFTYADAADQGLPPDAPVPVRGRLLSLKAHLALCADQLDATAHHAREALACLGPDDAVFRNLTANLLGQVLEARGDVVAAADVYREALRGEREVDQVGGLIVLTNLILALNELGHRREAVAVCEQAIEERTSGPGRALPVVEGICLASSLLSYEADELDQAEEQVMRSLRHAEQANIADGVLWGRLILARVHIARGAWDAARRVARQGRAYVARREVYEGKAQWFAGLEAHLSLLEGDLAAAGHWAEATGFTPFDAPHFWDEPQYLAYVRVLLAQRRLDDALRLLDTMEHAADKGERFRKLVTIYLLQAAAQRAAGRADRARALVTRALELAAPEGYRRAFLDEGPAIVDLLPRVRHLAPAFVSEVLESAPARAGGRPMPQACALAEPLTERELEILRLIAAGRSNPEIAELLFLSLNTVKWHAKNLYGKLQVGSRVEAVTRAQELQLL